MKREMSTERRAYSTQEVAQMFGVTPGAMRAWIFRGTIRVSHVGRKTLIPKSEIERLLVTQ
jgi:excisionase family DNA binding protein